MEIFLGELMLNNYADKSNISYTIKWTNHLPFSVPWTK